MVVDTLQREDSFETESNFDEFESKHLFQSISRSVKNKITNSRFFALQVKLQFLNFRRQRGSAVSRLTQAVARFRAGAGSGSHSYGLRNVFSDDLQSANLHILHIRASRSPPLTQTYAKETFSSPKKSASLSWKMIFSFIWNGQVYSSDKSKRRLASRPKFVREIWNDASGIRDIFGAIFGFFWGTTIMAKYK